MEKVALIPFLQELMENEARSCSMDLACVTPMYVYRMWGGTVALEEITDALQEVKSRLW